MKKEIFEHKGASELEINGIKKFNLINFSPSSQFEIDLLTGFEECGQIAEQIQEYDKVISQIYCERICKRVIDNCICSLTLSDETNKKTTSKKYKQVEQFVRNVFSAWYNDVKLGTGSSLSQIDTEDEFVDFIMAMIGTKLINHSYPFDIDD